MTTLHLCIATGQNAANFIPLKQLQAQEIWILETPEMQKQQSAKALTMALKSALPEAQLRTLGGHGEHDETVPLASVMDWARPQTLPVTVVPGGGHFFHGQLPLLKGLVARHLRAMA